MYIVFFHSSKEKDCVKMFSHANEVLALVGPQTEILAVRWLTVEGPVQEFDIKFKAGKLSLIRTYGGGNADA